jgi:predicted amidohydrolase
MKLTIGTSQFPVGADVEGNTQYVLRQMQEAKARGADVVHFCEGALSSYVDVDRPSFDGMDWTRLKDCTEQVMGRARDLELWVVLGSAHPLSPPHRPHNSVYVIDDRGELVDRYDKRFCTGDPSGSTGELAHFTPGDHPVVFTIRGLTCGILICHEYRYPELYREYKRKGVDLIFHSFHAANVDRTRLARMEGQVGHRFFASTRARTLPEVTMPAASQGAAASSHLWISCSNSSARESCWPALFVRADGVITGRLHRNRAGVLISTVDTEEQLYDSTVNWRGNAMRGVLHSGNLVEDDRSRFRTEL